MTLLLLAALLAQVPAAPGVRVQNKTLEGEGGGTITFSTAGSPRMISTIWPSLSRMAWNEMSCAACTMPVSRPVSCWGKKPLGTTP